MYVVYMAATGLTIVPIFPHGVFFEPGHMTSIEPGFYKEKEWGIRTESVFVCKSVDVSAVLAVST
jgi:hypothetical protein